MNLTELAQALNLEAKGAADTVIKGVRDVERLSPEQGLEAGFVYFIETPAVLKRHPLALRQGIILTTPTLAAQFSTALIAPEKEARPALIRLLNLFSKAPVFQAGVAPGATVHTSAQIDPTASILPGVVVMEGAVVGARARLYPGVVVEPFAEVGADCILYSNVVLGYNCKLGKSCILGGGTVIGADGFGFYDDASGRHKIPQIGNVEISDHVEMGAGCTVDRATIETTRIGEFTKFDDQVHVGHNCQLGRFIYIVGNSAIGGSVVIEDGAMISGMVIVKDHLHVGKGAIVMGMSGVAQDCEAKTAYFGTPARPARQMHKMNAALERLPELIAKVKELEAKLNPPQPAGSAAS